MRVFRSIFPFMVVVFVLLHFVGNTLALDGGVFFSEIAWMGTATSSNDEWMELYNNTPNDVDVSGWRVRADDGSPDVNLQGFITAYGYYLMERTDDESVPNMSADIIYTGTLGNTGESIGLYDSNDVQKDYVSQWFAGNNDTKLTMQKSYDDWCSAAATPRDQNGCPIEAEEPPIDDSTLGDGQPVEPAGSSAPVLRLMEIQPNGTSENGDYVEIFCERCDDGVLLSDISLNGKSAESADVLHTGDYLVFWYGKNNVGFADSFGMFHRKLGSTGLSGSRAEVVLGYMGNNIDALCWNEGGILDDADDDQQILRDMSLWQGACMNSSVLSDKVVLARNDTWKIDHSTPGKENDFANNPPKAIITLQGNKATNGIGTLSFNVTGENSVDEDGDTLTYLWNFDDGEINTNKNPTAHLYGVGTYNVRLTVTDSFGAQSIDSVAVQVGVASSSSGSSSFVFVQPTTVIDYDFSRNIVINEIFPDPKGKDDVAEFIELKNVGSQTVRLVGWQLDDEVGGSTPYKLSGELFADQIRSFSIKTTKLSLKNSGEAVRLIDPNNVVIEEMNYGKSQEGRSYSRNSMGNFVWTKPTEGMENVFNDVEKLSKGVVNKIIDGDTLEVNFSGMEQTVRLIGIDAPELHKPTKEPDFYAQEAYEALMRLVDAKEVTLEFDKDLFDSYDRLLAYVYVDGSLVNKELLREGFVKLYDFFPFIKQEDFKIVYDEAKKNGVGMWATMPVAPTPDEPIVDMDVPPPHVIFTEFLVNPIGKDDGKEYFILYNSGEEVDTAGWKIFVNDKGYKLPSIILTSGERRQITGADMNMSLRNSDAVIRLIDLNGNVLSEFAYTDAVPESAVFAYDIDVETWQVVFLNNDFVVDEDDQNVTKKEMKELLPTFDDLLGGRQVANRVLQNVLLADISRLHDGVVGVEHDEICSDVFFDDTKQSVQLLKLLFKQKRRLSFELACYGDFCVLYKIDF